ncbi:hypothetical protein ABH922_002713 [Rhodococcus sp. 27YEA15]|uniref:hypothetical protein n=1 Tax=Rhodococcus sp. 27YEA15 TaxID=3156259 RepID=UPI003C7D0DD2
MLLTAVPISLLALTSMRSNSGIAVTVSYLGLSLVLVGCSAGLFDRAGFRFRSRSAVRHVHFESTPAVTIVSPRLSNIGLSVMMSGLFVCAALSLLSWFLGWSSLIPAGGAGWLGATLSGIGAIIALLVLLFVALTQAAVTVHLTPDGVEIEETRDAPFWHRRSGVRAHWEQIEEMIPDSIAYGYGFAPLAAAVIDLRLAKEADVYGPSWAFKCGNYRVALHLLPMEPNLLFAVLQQLHLHPESRQVLKEEAFREMCKLPALRARWKESSRSTIDERAPRWTP